MKNKRKSQFVWTKWGIIVAGLALLVLCIPMVNHLLPTVDDNTPDEDPY